MNEVINPMMQALEQRAVMPYAPVRDDVVIGILLGCFLILVAAMADGSGYLQRLVSHCTSGRVHKADDEAHTSRSFYLRTLLLIQACTSCSLCLTLAAHADGLATDASSVLTFWLYGTIAVAAAMVVKFVFFRFVNSVILTKTQSTEWIQLYYDLFILSGFLFFLLAMASTFAELSMPAIRISAIAFLIFMETGLLLRSFPIFFTKKYGVLQFFVYLCTLEWIPLLVAGKAIVQLCSTI